MKLLDYDLLLSLTDAVVAEFPNTSASVVLAAVRRKCNNEQFAKEKRDV